MIVSFEVIVCWCLQLDARQKYVKLSQRNGFQECGYVIVEGVMISGMATSSLFRMGTELMDREMQ